MLFTLIELTPWVRMCVAKTVFISKYIKKKGYQHKNHEGLELFEGEKIVSLFLFLGVISF